MILVSLRVSTETGRRTGTRRRGRRIGRNRERMVAVIRIDEMTRKVGAGDPFIKLRAETSPPHAVRAATARRLAVDEGLDLVVMTGNVRIQRRSSRCSLIGDSIRNGRGSGILDDDSGNSDSGRVDVDRNGSSGWIRGRDGVFSSSGFGNEDAGRDRNGAEDRRLDTGDGDHGRLGAHVDAEIDVVDNLLNLVRARPQRLELGGETLARLGSVDHHKVAFCKRHIAAAFVILGLGA